MAVEIRSVEGPALLSPSASAALDRAVEVARSIFPATAATIATLRARGLTEDRLADDLDERARQVEAAATDLESFRTAQEAREWYGANHGRIAIEAFEESRPRIVPVLEQADAGGATSLEPNSAQPAPDWWRAHAIHRTQGGWDGHEYMGYVQGAIVHHGLVARILAPADIYAQRRAVAREVAALGGRRVLELGAGNGPYTAALAEAMPDAEIVACDLSLRQLEQARRVLNVRGARVRLLRADAAATGLESDRFDVVTSYALLHEMPVHATEAALAEALRVLAPGGTLYFVDVPPFDRLDRYRQWSADHGARHEGEPFWREAATLDVAGVLARLGFEQVRRYGPDGSAYPFPFVTRATKPR